MNSYLPMWTWRLSTHQVSRRRLYIRDVLHPNEGATTCVCISLHFWNRYMLLCAYSPDAYGFFYSLMRRRKLCLCAAQASRKRPGGRRGAAKSPSAVIVTATPVNAISATSTCTSRLTELQPDLRCSAPGLQPDRIHC